MRKFFIFLTVALLCYNLSATHEHSIRKFTQEYNIQKYTLQSSRKSYEQTFFIRYIEMKKVFTRHLYTDINVTSALEINLMLCCILIHIPLFSYSPATQLLPRIRSPSQDNKKTV